MSLRVEQEVLSGERWPVKISPSGTEETFMWTRNENAQDHDTYIWFDIAMYEAQSVTRFDGEHHLYYCGVDVDTRFVES